MYNEIGNVVSMEINKAITPPKLMTVRQIAKTGVISEFALRRMIKEGVVKPIYSGNRALLNFNKVCSTIDSLTCVS